MKKRIKETEQFRAKVDEIIEQVLNQDAATSLAIKAQKKLNPPSLEDSLDFLRLNVKYLLFDLEATRRENEHLRQLLKEEK